MKKILTLILFTIIMFSSFSNVILAAVVDANRGGVPTGTGGSGGSGGGGPRDSAARGQLIIYGRHIYTVGYRATFVYAGLDGSYYPVNVKRTSGSRTREVASMDFLIGSTLSNIEGHAMKYISDVKGSKAEYLKKNSAEQTLNLVTTWDGSNYVKGIHYKWISEFPQLTSYYNTYLKASIKKNINFKNCIQGSVNNAYCYGASLFELFTGSAETDSWQQTILTAKQLGVLSPDATFDDLVKISQDSKGRSLKLLVEPLLMVYYGGHSGYGSSSGWGIMTLTEVLTVYLANNSNNGWKKVGATYVVSGNYSSNNNIKLRTEDAYKRRYQCGSPGRFFLDHPDEELKIAQHYQTGILSYLGTKGINACTSATGGLVTEYKNKLPSLVNDFCFKGDCYYNYLTNNYFSIKSGVIYLNQSYVYNHMGVMILDLYDTFGGGRCPVIYRTISLTDPFPGYKGDGREMGANWQSENNKIVEDVIINNRGTYADNVYNLTPKYTITLTPVLIKSIRDYNKRITNGYSNDSLTCDGNGKNCKSKFIRNDYKSNFSGCAVNGTC